MANSETGVKAKHPVVDFSDTEIAFAGKNNSELKLTAWLFRFMNKHWLVQTASSFGLWLNKANINIFNPIIRQTFFKQFCGGISLEDSSEAIAHLMENNTHTVLDYGAEGKTEDDEFDQTLEENIKAIRFASSSSSVPMISSKVTALGAEALLEKYQTGATLNSEESIALEKIRQRVHQLCQAANDHGISIFIDAEDSWIQAPIDEMTANVMEQFNRQKAVVYKTYQMYRKDKLRELHADHKAAVEKGYILGAKIVRGAYMEKERKRAEEMNYPSPIHDTKADTDRDFNKAITYCLENYQEIATCNATHNLFSNQFFAEMIVEKGLSKKHPHLYFCQLYGMSDNITFNLAAAGFNVAKILPYGPVRDVIPYLIRRARENTSVTGEMSRELSLIVTEMKRRGIK